jgi:hypothetical protein
VSIAEQDISEIRGKEFIPDSQQSLLPDPVERTDEETQSMEISKVHEIPESSSPARPNRSEQDSQASSPVLTMLSQAKSATSIRGLRTATTYYTPLPHLMRHMNRSSQFDSRVSILAVVVRAMSKPERAERGARDYFAKFRISQPDAWPTTTLATVFRPVRNALPVLAKGDVVLLSLFDVVALKGGTNGVRSGEGSGWCVWKMPAASVGGGRARDGLRPVWTWKSGEKPGKGSVDEIVGPPVEFGDEEREEAERLASWWTGVDGAKL